MSDIINNLKKFGEDMNTASASLVDMLKNPSVQISAVIIFIIFFSISIAIYFRFIHPKINPTYVDNSEFIRREDNKMVVLWFYTQWCPYCKSTYNEWENFKADAALKDFPIEVEFREVDCEIDPIIADRYNIQEYPSIRIVYKDEVFIYDAKPDRIELMNFLNGSMPNNITFSDIKNDIIDSAQVAFVGSKL